MKLWKRFCKQTWSPWVCGAILGIASVLSLVLLDKTLGASGGYSSIMSIIFSWLGADAANSLYYTAIKPPEVTPTMILYIGMIAGALIGAISSKSFKIRKVPDKQWTERFGKSVAKRWLYMFIGCTIIAFGAGVAGGCTSGLGVGGMMQLAPAGILFFAGCFGGGIIASVIIYRKKVRK